MADKGGTLVDVIVALAGKSPDANEQLAELCLRASIDHGNPYIVAQPNVAMAILRKGYLHDVELLCERAMGDLFDEVLNFCDFPPCGLYAMRKIVIVAPPDLLSVARGSAERRGLFVAEERTTSIGCAAAA